MTKILSGLLLILTVVVGWNIFSSVSFTPRSTPLSPFPPEKGNPPMEEVSPLRNTSTFLTRLSLTPSTSIEAPLIAIVIENHKNARPFQKGLDRARVVAEFLVEGLISRFVALFAITDLPEQVGPVRSLRPYFVDALRPWTALFLYAGGSPEALDNIDHANISHLNGLFLPEYFIRDKKIAEPHNLFLSKKSLQELWTYSPQVQSSLLHIPHGPLLSDQHAQEIRVNFFNPVYNVRFTYDPFTASYIRTNGDMETPTRPRNILILQAPIKNIGSYGRLDIPLEGTGSLLLFQSGKMTRGTWEKNSADQPFSFFDIQQKPLQFANGQIWMMVLETMKRVKWE